MKAPPTNGSTSGNDDWSDGSLADLCSLVSDQCDPAKSDHKIYVGLEHIDSGAFTISRHGSPKEVVSAKNRFKKNDILYGKLRPYLDKALIAQQEGICSTDILVFRPRENVSPLFILAVIHSKPFTEYAVQTTHGLNHPRTSWAALRDFECPIPPFSEQEKIAAVLWKIQKAVEIEDAIVRNARDLKKSLLRRLFTHGLRGEPLKETEIGLVPQSWEVVSLGDIARIGNGSTPKRDNTAYWHNGTIPWLTSAKVYEGVIKHADEFVTDVAIRECHLPRVKPGSLLIAITGQGKTLGNVAITEIETTISQHLAFAQFNRTDVESNFIRFFFDQQYEYLRQVASGGGSTKGALTCGFLKSFPVPLTTRDEQLQIVHILQTVDRKIDIHESRKRSLQDLFKTSLNKLMTAQIRVDDLDIDTSEVETPTN
jgi:type I restriction enzyme S subunit